MSCKPTTPESSQDITNNVTEDTIVPVAIKVDTIDNETLEKLKAQGLLINDTEQSKVYGNVVFGVINQSAIKNLSGEIKQNSEKEYKSNVLKTVAIDYNSGWASNDRDLTFLTEGQVGLDERREKAGIIIGPLIEQQLIERVEKEKFVPIAIRFRIEAWDNYEENFKEIQSELDSNLKIEKSGSAGISGYINKEGLEKLKNKEYIIQIAMRNTKVIQE